MTIWTIELLAHRPPLSLNYRMTTHQEARIIAQLRADACNLARAAKIGHHGRVRVELHWAPSTRTVIVDEDNPVPTLKALCDGLVDAGVVEDDDRWRMTKTIVIHDRDGRGRMWLTVEPLPELPSAPPPRRQPEKRPRAPRRPRSATIPSPPATPTPPPRAVSEWSARVAARHQRRRGGGAAGG